MPNKGLIFVVLYNSENHIEDVLKRIPAKVWDDPSLQVLCIDDNSSDQSASVGAAWIKNKKIRNCRFLRNKTNLGYGGNQKLGYRYALDHGFDYVVLLHGDGQYAPEMLPQFIGVMENAHSDVLLGTRMAEWGHARKGGMPFYKMFGNKVLTFIQNRLTNQRLSEYHTGYRAYSADFLKRIPFEQNTDDFHFDTEILLQGFSVQARIREISIPTYYGTETCHVNGLKYATQVLMSTLKYKFQCIGVLVQPMNPSGTHALKVRSLIHQAQVMVEPPTSGAKQVSLQPYQR